LPKREASAKTFALITILISHPRESSANPKGFLQANTCKAWRWAVLWVREEAVRAGKQPLMASGQVFSIIGC
jgi:hypothetical protein